MSATSVAMADRAAVRTRDEEFGELFRAEFPRLAGYCLRLLSDEQLARDTAQEALVRVWSRWRAVADPRAYAYVVATNLARAEWRRRSNGRVLLRRLAGAHDDVHHDRDSSLLDAVRRLPPRLRDPVLLHYFADLPLAEVATVLDRPVGSVKQRLHQARGELATMLEDR